MIMEFIFLKKNTDKLKEILSVIIYLYFIEVDCYDYLSRLSRENILNNQ